MASSPQGYLPTTPPSRRERPKSSWSFRSDKSSETKPKIDLTETKNDKRRLNIASKANPNSAINEAEPGVRTLAEGNTMGDIRALEHRDLDGNVIVDADRSNPTRPRLERPLDTIRSFEAAIDDKYRKSDSPRTEVASNYGGYASRRSSSYNALDQFHGSGSRRSMVNGYYSSRSNTRQDYYENSYQSSPVMYNRQPMNQRQHSEPMLGSRNYYNYGPPPQQQYANNYYDSYNYDTNHSASNGSASTEPWGNSTDPSSENSSIDRTNGYSKPDTYDPYARGNPIQQPVMEEAGVGGRSYPQSSFRPPPQINRNTRAAYPQGPNGTGQVYQNDYSQPPPPPPKNKGKLSKSDGNTGKQSSFKYNGNAPSSKTSTRAPEKPARQSWLKRTFSARRS